ncbi:MAG: C40 family peptidase [Pseudomonadota bacterium]
MTKGLIGVFVLLTSGCAWDSESRYPAPGASSPTVVSDYGHAPTIVADRQSDLGWIVASLAQQQVGVPYLYGGDSPSGFDCSGLVNYAYREAGLTVPRTTGELWRRARAVDRRDARPGDLVFFDIDGKPGHVGLYVGDGFFVHAPSTGHEVRTQPLDSPWYSSRLLRVARLID